MELIKTDCALCVNCCGLDVYVDDGKIVKIEGSSENPINRGRLCPKGERLIEWQYSPDRLKYPMKRENGTWKRVSWDEALDTIADELRDIKEKFGAHALAVHVGSVGVEHIVCSYFAQRFRGAFGTPNFFTVDSGCWRARILARLLTFGRFPSEDTENARCIILWGHNPDASRFPVARQIREAVSKGAKLIVIDPRRIPLAKEGIYLQIRPGTDVALALAMMNVIIAEGLYDKEFVDEWTYGFAELVEHVKEYTPEKVAEITWVPAADIERCARMYAQNAPASIIQGVCSLDRQINNIQNSRVLSILQTITGNIDNPGGWVSTKPVRTADLRVPVSEEPIGAAEYPAFHYLWGRPNPYGHSMLFPDAVLTEKPYPIKALVVAGGNPALTLPDSQKYKQALEKLDLVVVIELVMSKTAELADLVLPACSFLEETSLGSFPSVAMHGIPWVNLRKKTVEPLGECWPVWKIFSALGRHLGHGEYFPWETDEEMMTMLLAKSGISLDKLIENPSGFAYTAKDYGLYKTRGFGTPSKKVEIYSETLKKAGFDPLPTHIEPTQSYVKSPELAQDYPLILITGNRTPEYINAQLRHVTGLTKIAPEALMEINPGTAAKYGLVDDEMVYVETPVGRIKIRAKFTQDIAQQVVSIPHGWVDGNVNNLTDITIRDPIGGYPEDKGILCRVKKCD